MLSSLVAITVSLITGRQYLPRETSELIEHWPAKVVHQRLEFTEAKVRHESLARGTGEFYSLPEEVIRILPAGTVEREGGYAYDSPYFLKVVTKRGIQAVIRVPSSAVTGDYKVWLRPTKQPTVL